MLPAEILGQIYEQFLGKVIRLDEGHNAVVDDKPEVKKAGGVKYTPAYIVEYIVQNTVGPLLKGKTLQEAAALRVLDPACGSGSFLIVAYQHLLDWHKEWYIQNLVPLIESGRMSDIKKLLPAASPTRGKKGRSREPELPIYLGRGDEWKLTTAERKRILLNNIYGVDIDRQAVEVTKLSLLLKVLEGENEETISKQLKLFAERALPDLSRNIKCGNSLIGWDILKDNPGMGPEEIERINPFDWEKEFPEVVHSGGFSFVIGNPPYVRQEMLGEFKSYFQRHYMVYHGIADLYTYFIERGVSLLKENGILSYIVANKWMRANYGNPIRRWLKNQCIEEIIDFKDLPIFQGATTYPCIIRISKKAPSANFKVTQVKTLSFINLDNYIGKNSYFVEVAKLDENGWPLADEHSYMLLEKLKLSGVPQEEYVDGNIYNGIKTGLNEAFVIDLKTKDKIISEDSRSIEVMKPFLVGRDLKRYQSPKSDHFLIYIPWHFPRHNDYDIISASAKAEAKFMEEYPAVFKHLLAFKHKLIDRDRKETNIKYEWYALQRPRQEYYQEFKKPKIMLPDISARGNFTLDDEGKYLTANAAYIISSVSSVL
ncbi:MAG: hypothetical protein E4G89_04565 [Methanothrix sp.]|nr:MAG: hypothetical protein E4G89_04565 [Methanothrix sp.]